MNREAFPTAASAGYRMPAEWTRHACCWMSWPCRSVVWGDNLAATQRTYAEVANAIAEFEPLIMLAAPTDIENCRGQCSDKITVLPVDIDDSWMRDNGPNFVVDDQGNLAASIFHFNAGVAKYQPWGKDAAVGHRIAEYLKIPTFTSTIFMEGGGINVDGEGTLLTTQQCVLHENRNPGLEKEIAAQAFREALGVEKIIWLPGDPEDTETDGHIDGIACFLEAGRVLVEVCPAKGTARYDIMQANLEAVRGQTDAAGRELDIEIIEEAYEAECPNEIFASSYINYYIANGAIIMPSFGIDRDQDARDQLAALYPDREIVQVDITYIARGGGGIHCITQQQPVSAID